MYAKFKKMITDELNKVIGGSSSQHQYEDEAGTPESYVRNGGENKDMSENIEKTTEPDPEGDIAVLKSVNSDLARRKISKAIDSLEKALANLPDTSRASDVNVSQEAAPVNKSVDSTDLTQVVTKSAQDYLSSAKRSIKKALANLPDTGRAASVSVSQEAAPINKNVGNPDSVDGVGANSEPANPTTSTDAEPMTKADDCGPDCEGCTKCSGMSKDVTSEEVVEKAADTDKDGDTESDTDKDGDAIKKSVDEVVLESQSQTSLEMINNAKMDISDSVWGGSFSAPVIPRIK